MADGRTEWLRAREELITAMMSLGHSEELAVLLARQLAGTGAIRRMTAYLHHAKPRHAEEVVDEALAICAEIDAWRRKKEGEEANAKITEMYNAGLDGEE